MDRINVDPALVAWCAEHCGKVSQEAAQVPV